MNILLYSPDNGVTRNVMPHLWMFLLKALTPVEHRVFLIDGNAQPMWVALGATGETLASPSPDGRHLALQTWTNNGNLWMLENF